jgi:hypothetical protein
MAWPTTSEVKSQFEKLNDSAFDTKIGRAITFASSRVMAAGRAAGYDVSSWTASTPPLCYDIALYLTYGYFAPRVHTGSALNPSDEAAKDARDYAEELLDKLFRGELVILDSSGLPVATVAVGVGYIHRRTDGSVFGPGEPDTWAVTLLEEGSEMT